MKHSTLIKRAKRLLYMQSSYHINSYVCNAIESAVQSDHQEFLMFQIHDLIRKRLEGHSTIYSWLSNKVGIKVMSNATDEELQNYRLRWMDSLIQEYKEAGK